MIKAVIYDMDGLIIDTEPFWKEVEIEVFGHLGLTLTEGDCAETAGLRIDEVVDYWQHRNPELSLQKEKTVQRILVRMEEFILTQGVALPGLYDSLNYFKSKKLKLAIASSSPFILINACVKSLGLLSYFVQNSLTSVCENGNEFNGSLFFSAQTEQQGKPAPDIFLSCVKSLGIPADECLVLEDSVAGVMAGKAAGMKVVAIPNANSSDDSRFAIADFTLSSLEEITQLNLF